MSKGVVARNSLGDYMNEQLTNLLKEEAKASYASFKGDTEAIYAFVAKYDLTLAEHIKLHSMNYNRYKRVLYLRNKVSDIVLNGKAIFLTLTFTDDVLASTSVETRRKYVRRYLKEECEKYCANIDFGSQNGREHYHAIISAKNDSADLHKWQYGAINAQRIRASENDCKKTCKYIAKLTAHAIKESTGHAYRIIYSR